MEFRLLGTVALLVDGRPVELGWRRERCLLGLLLLHVGRTVPADRLVALLWEDAPPANPRAALQIHVSRLRARLAAAGAERHGVTLGRSRGGYVVEADPLTVDVHRFRHLVDQARAHAGAAERSRTLRTALALWAGAPLADVASDRLRDRVCADLDEVHHAALEQCVEAELELGLHRELVPELTALVAAHPSRERLLAALMTALHGSGRKRDALAVYERGKRRLAAELGLDPGPELRRLHALILRDGPPADPSADPPGDPPGGAPAAPGTAGPPSRQRPTSAAWAPRTVHLGPAQLPAGVPVFVGRERHLAELDRLLLADGGPVRTVVVTGSGGVGKTALAVHWGQRVAARFPDGQLFADLRGYAQVPPARPEEVLARFLRALGVARDDVPVDLDEQAALYRTLLAGRRVLVMLDNACGPEHVRPLLPVGDCRTLVTSRDRLGGLVALDGAGVLGLDVLDPGEAHELLAGVVGESRLAREPDAARELVRLCGFLPLALRTAGANLAVNPHQSVAGYTAQLGEGNRLAALRVDDDERAAVTATFTLSYQRLAEPDRRLFRLLGLVPGPDVTAEVAAVLSGTAEEEARGGLERLAAAHLCERREPSGRYALHDLLRLYAVDRARTDEDPAARADAVRRLLDWYLHRTDAAARLLYPHLLRLPLDPDPAAEFPDAAAALSWLEAELANLVDAVRYAADEGFGRTAWLLADALRGFFALHSFAVDWLGIAETALSAARSAGDLCGQAAALANLGQAVAVGTHGGRHRAQGRVDQAVGYLTAALELSERAGWTDGQMAILHNLAIVHHESGNLERAAGYARQRLDLPASAHLSRGLSLAVLANVYQSMGRLDEALDHALRAMDLVTPADPVRIRARVLNTLAAVHHDAGRYDEASALADRARLLVGESGGMRSQADCLSLLGAVQHGLGNHEDAVRLYRNGLELARDVGHRWVEAVALTGLSVAQRAAGETGPALDLAGQALALARSSGYRILEGPALTALAAAHLALGRPGDAAAHAEEALALQRAVGQRLGAARTLVVLARAEREADTEPSGVAGRLREALSVLSDCGAHADADQVRGLLAEVLADLSRAPTGRSRPPGG